MAEGNIVLLKELQCIRSVLESQNANNVVADIDYETKFLCDPSGVEVLVVIGIDKTTGIPTNNYYNTTTGAAYAGVVANLGQCSDSDSESDSVLFCDGGTEFLRWFIKKDGTPTGVIFNTTLGGATYSPSGSETLGKCEVGVSPITITGTQTINAVNASQMLSMPANTKYAVGQVINGSIVFTVDGSTPVEGTNGYIESFKFVLETTEEITNFSTIASSMTNNTATIYITYYDSIIDTGGF